MVLDARVPDDELRALGDFYAEHERHYRSRRFAGTLAMRNATRHRTAVHERIGAALAGASPRP